MRCAELAAGVTPPPPSDEAFEEPLAGAANLRVLALLGGSADPSSVTASEDERPPRGPLPRLLAATARRAEGIGRHLARRRDHARRRARARAGARRRPRPGRDPDVRRRRRRWFGVRPRRLGRRSDASAGSTSDSQSRPSSPLARAAASPPTSPRTTANLRPPGDVGLVLRGAIGRKRLCPVRRRGRRRGRGPARSHCSASRGRRQRRSLGK